MHALAPRWTRARTCALQIVPAPPVQKTTLLSGGTRGQLLEHASRRKDIEIWMRLTEDAISPDIAQVFILGRDHDGRRSSQIRLELFD